MPAIPPRATGYVSTGSTLLNLALTGNPFAGWAKGSYDFFVGDSSSGKTFFAMATFAEASLNPEFDDYDLVYDNIEDGMMMNLDMIFSEEMADRVRPPRLVGGKPDYSATAEDFYFNIDDLQAKGKPFIYILDSMDALDSKAAAKKFEQHKKAHRKARARAEGETTGGGEDEKVAGSYGDGKAKINSEFLRKVSNKLNKTGSILIIISQTRDAINSPIPGMKTRAGGRALRFYARSEVWSSVKGQIKKNVNGRDRNVGTRVGLDLKKNRITGLLNKVEIDIYPSFGIDDLGTCIDYLVDEEWWPLEKLTIDAQKGLGISGTRDKLIRHIEKNGLEDKLRTECGKCWDAIVKASALPRKNRYQRETE